jgi:hypothetical protein
LKVYADVFHPASGPGNTSLRERQYQVFDTVGRRWHNSASDPNPLTVKEIITPIAIDPPNGAPPETGQGVWQTANNRINAIGIMEDDQLSQSTPKPPQFFLQQFWASGFNLPSNHALPSVVGLPSNSIPLAILQYVPVGPRVYEGTQTICMTSNAISIDNDQGKFASLGCTVK